jgi:hypothetical protein
MYPGFVVPIPTPSNLVKLVVSSMDIAVVDDEGGEAVTEWNIMVGNIALVEAGPNAIIAEGSSFLSNGFIADADSPSYTAIVDYYDETGPQPLPLYEGNTFVLDHVYADDGVYTVLVTVF